MRLSRTTGAGAGLLVLVLGLWAGFSPFVGPYFHYGFTPDSTWHYTADRLWLNILPAAAAVLGGLMLMGSARRASGVLGGWIALMGGLWLIAGPSVSMLWEHPAGGTLQSGIGAPLGGYVRGAAEMIGVFYGVGALVTLLSAFAIGRFALAPALAPAGTLAREEGAGAGAAGSGGPPAREEAPRRRGLMRRRRRGAESVERDEGARRL